MTSQPKALIAVAPEPRELIDRALRFVAQRGWSGPDGGFLLALARFVSDLLDVEYVLIDRLAEAPECAETVAFCARERQLPNAIYPLRDTPCENVFGKSMCIYPRGVAGLFPRDALLRDLGVESYAGLPLWSAAGEPIGLIAVMDVKPLPDDDAVAAVLQIVAARAAYELESQRAEEERRAHLRFLECLDQVDAAMRGVTDLGQMLGRALDVVLAAFACDRVSLVYPCDPDAPTCVCPMERVRPEYPGVFQVGAELPVDEDIARGFRVAAESIDPVQFGPGGRYPVAGKVAERHGIQAVLLMALRPRIGKPWLLCLNQCSHPRVWTRAEERLFQEIGRRLADGLTGLLAYRDVQQSERLFRSVAEHSPDLISRVDRDGRYVYISPIVRRFTGLPPEAFIGQPIGASRVAAGHVTDPDGLRQLQAAVRAVFETGQQQRCEIAMDGGVGGLFSDYVLVPERDDDGRIVSALCIARDTTERRRNEDVQKKLNRSLRLLSDFNQMLVHAQSERQLLDSGCRIVVESGGYAYASIRLAAPQAPQDGATFIAHGRQAAYADPGIEGILRDVAPGVETAGDVRIWRRPDRPHAGAPPAPRGEPAAPASCVALALRHVEQDLGVLHILSDDEA
ncbi:MAG TPA: PAS domain-containing protein, partial [Burkholderiaceae bacterium]|nr:PAS domain-containing protein [Burkholderiaceae bacterium]